MATDYEVRRRRKKLADDKLLVGDEVEVLFMDEGLSGSWHSGIVTNIGINCHLVEYTHLLNDDNQSKLEQWVTVSSAVSGDYKLTSEIYRGNIRPLQSHQNIQVTDVKYGLCVDALVEDAWWEGVVYDEEENSPERSIFFPDEGDVQKISIDKLRNTRDWDDVSGTWKPRGKWVLFQVLELFEEKDALPVSIREIWYDLRSTNVFIDKIGFWPCGSLHIWYKLVLNLMKELLYVINGQLNHALSTSEANNNSCPNALSEFIYEFHNRDAPQGPAWRRKFINKRHNAKSELLSNGWKFPDNIYVSPEGEHFNSLIEACEASAAVGQKHKFQDIMNNSRDDIVVCNNQFDKKSKKSWNPVELQPEYCVDLSSICQSYVKYGRAKVSVENIQKLKKHLVYEGWTIEFKRDTMPRFRYVTPDGNTYHYSLNMVCCDLVDQRYSTGGELLELGEDVVLKNEEIKDSKDKLKLANSEALLNSSSMFPSTPAVVVHEQAFKQEHVPKVIQKYMDLIEKGQWKKDRILTDKAKEYLKLKGWRLWKKNKQTKKELLYTSPGGKNYISLYRACKGYLEEYQKISTEKPPKRTKMAEQLEVQQAKSRPSIRKHTGPSSSSPRHLLRSSKRSQLNVEPSTSHVSKTVLSWLIDKDVILPREKVTYIRKRDGRAMKHGRVSRDGIKCKCCDKVFNLANFEAHSGCSSTSLPASSIFLSDGMSLLEYQMKVVNSNKPVPVQHVQLKRNLSICEGDTECSICCDGGNLVLCDHCPSAFHPGCVGLEDVPEGNWSCPSCQCQICGLSEFNCETNQFTEKSVLCCDQCEQGYHVGCLRDRGLSQLSSCPTGSWVCSKKCSKIFNHLKKLLGKPNQTRIEGLTWTILRSRSSEKFDDETIAEFNSKLYIALDVLHECFEPFIEPRTKSDVVADLLFNRESELNRLNFWGIYTIILERGDELISVATLRVFDEKVAEMPFIGTRFQFRRKGMCRLLVDEIEEFLSALGVERLVLPAVPQLLQTWTGSFGFTQMTKSDRIKLLEYKLLSFHDAPLCQKFLTKSSKILEQSRGNCKRLRSGSVEGPDICKRSRRGSVDFDNCSIASEVMEVVESFEKSIEASTGEETNFLPDVGDAVEENSHQVDIALSLLMNCYEGQEQMKDKTSVSIFPGRCEDNCSVEEPRSALTVSCSRALFVKDRDGVTTGGLKYVYKRRVLWSR